MVSQNVLVAIVGYIITPVSKIKIKVVNSGCRYGDRCLFNEK